MMEIKLKTSYKRRMITYYTVLILSLTVIGVSACLLSTRNFTGDIKDRQEEVPYYFAFLLWGILTFVFITWTQFKLL